MSRRQPRRPDPEVQHAREKDVRQQSQTTGTAMQRAAEDMPSLGELQSREFIDSAFTPDVNRGDGVPGIPNNNIEEKFAAEFGRHAGLGNITTEEWERRKLLNKAKGILALQEMARPNGLGSRCNPQLRRQMTGEDEGLVTRSDDMAREVREAFEEKSMLESLSRDARGFRGLTEVTAVSRAEGNDTESSSGGMLSRATSFIFGG
jgi:hypothetical protein